jgi:hypothetical protein
MGALWLNQDQSITLDIQWALGTSTATGETPATDGDHYVVTLTTSGGLTSTLLDQAATYQPYTPNGPDCPPVCPQAMLSS